jgi:hypothetical protein
MLIRSHARRTDKQTMTILYPIVLHFPAAARTRNRFAITKLQPTLPVIAWNNGFQSCNVSTPLSMLIITASPDKLILLLSRYLWRFSDECGGVDEQRRRSQRILIFLGDVVVQLGCSLHTPGGPGIRLRGRAASEVAMFSSIRRHSRPVAWREPRQTRV